MRLAATRDVIHNLSLQNERPMKIGSLYRERERLSKRETERERESERGDELGILNFNVL